jgi:hypothetical protein
MDVKHPHIHTVTYEADINDLPRYQRQVIQRHYDFIRWCENNTTSSYLLDTQYSPDGITVGFETDEDYQRFLVFSANYYWIFLQN